MVKPSGQATRVFAVLWPLVLAVLLVLPLLTSSGHPLARDLVFVPHQPWTDARIGLGDAAARAVPLDALISALTAVVDGGLLARFLLPIAIAAAGWGVFRALEGLATPARLTSAGLAVWNPFVVERLTLGQWALVMAYAALPWIVVASRAYRSRTPGSLPQIVFWGALASLTPTGGLLALATTVAFTSARRVRSLGPALAVAVMQLPWLVPSLTGTAGAISDPDGVGAFAARAEGPGGAGVALLGLGGIWDSRSVPATRETWWGTATAALVVIVLVAGWPALRRLWGVADAGRLLALGASGFLLAALSATGPGQDLLEWLVVTVPGAGLLRDSQKFLAPFVLLVVLAAGAAADRVTARLRGWGTEARASALMVLLAVPFIVLPDAVWSTWRTFEPVSYPSDFRVVAREIAADEGEPRLVTLPWRAYRAFSWGNGQIASDPAARWFDAELIASGDLTVNDVVVEGESPTGAAIGDALAEGQRPADVLADVGVSWVMVYRDDPRTDEVDTSGLDLIHEGAQLSLWRVPDPADRVPVPGLRRAAVVVGDVLAALTVLAALAVLGANARARRTKTRRPW